MQQYLPFTVLKPLDASAKIFSFIVATVLTVYGIETSSDKLRNNQNLIVATVLTVYGIETGKTLSADVRYLQLQQYLPFTVCDEGCEAAETRSDDAALVFLI